MSEATQSTDELVSEYTSARHTYALASKDGAIDHAIESHNNATEIEDTLESRGVSIEKLREFWSDYADAHGLDH